jgi:glucose/arabinose dehydrogenase
VSASRFFVSCAGAVQLVVVAIALTVARPGWPQDGARNAKSVTVSNARLENPSVAQAGKSADAIRLNLKDIKLPPGFRIELYALVPGARHMALAPSSNLLFVGSRRTTLWVVADRNNDGVADEVKPFANALNFELPNGVCWTKDGALIVVELNRVLRFPAAQAAYDAEQVAVIEVVPQGQLIPPAEESPGHGARTCRVAPDGKLYITLGQPYNVQPAEKIELYEKLGIGGVIRINPLDGSAREVVARGLRNPVGIEVANDGVIWTTDNQTDGMGDDIPPGKLSRHTQIGAHHGYPWVIGTVTIPDSIAGYPLSQIPPPKHIQPPQLELPAHAADLGLTQYNATAFPKRYHGAFFIAERGSWNRTKPIGARVMVAYTKADGTAFTLEPFAYGWLDEKTGSYRGRPVDVAIMKDGSMLISDDHAGAIYRVTYRAR